MNNKKHNKKKVKIKIAKKIKQLEHNQQQQLQQIGDLVK